MKLKQFLIDHRENLQLIYGVLLIVLIPSLIALNTISLIGRYNESMDVALQRQALGMGRSIYASLQDSLSDKDEIQRKIEKIYEKESAFEVIEVLVPDSKGFEIVASSEKENIGKAVSFYYYDVAWSRPDNSGLSTDSITLATDENGDSMAAYENSGRFWLVAMPMQDETGEKKAVLSMKISSEVVDNLTRENRDISLLILAVTVAITILFLSVTVRLWDYVTLYRRIKEVDQMKDEFISIASHELRTPLTSIKGYASLIAEETFGKIENAEMKKSLDRIMSSTKRLEDLVEDLLNVSRLEQGRLSIEKKDIEIEPVIEEIVAQLSVNAEAKKLSLSYEKPEKKLPLVFADPERTKQVLINLIGNAVKYTETGSVVVDSKIKDNFINIRVTDTGIGISPEAQQSLFQKFYRVKTEKTQTIQGTGLGLWITKQIVELMNGKIYLESIEGRGTQVTLILPLAARQR